jgi:guanine deaminase
MTDQDLMRIALETARQGVMQGQMPFGACIARGSHLIATAHNQVVTSGDVTAHAEVQAIRAAGLRIPGDGLTGCTMYCTCEPCPMCLAACAVADLARVIFACRIEDAERAGIAQHRLSASQLNRHLRTGITVVGEVLRDEGCALFEAWRRQGAASI